MICYHLCLHSPKWIVSGPCMFFGDNLTSIYLGSIIYCYWRIIFDYGSTCSTYRVFAEFPPLIPTRIARDTGLWWCKNLSSYDGFHGEMRMKLFQSHRKKKKHCSRVESSLSYIHPSISIVKPVILKVERHSCSLAW